MLPFWSADESDRRVKEPPRSFSFESISARFGPYIPSSYGRFHSEGSSRFASIEPNVRVKSKHIFFFFLYLSVSSLFLSITSFIKCHPLFPLMHFVNITGLCAMMWGKLGKMAYEQNLPESHVTRKEQVPEVRRQVPLEESTEGRYESEGREPSNSTVYNTPTQERKESGSSIMHPLEEESEDLEL